VKRAEKDEDVGAGGRPRRGDGTLVASLPCHTPPLKWKMFRFLSGRVAKSDFREDVSGSTSKPIFQGEFIAFSEFDRHALRALIKGIQKPFLRIAEIGSWTGKGSTKTIIGEIQGGRGVLYCIDHWQGNPGVQRHSDLVAKFDMLGTFRFNVASFGGGAVVKPMVMSSKDAAGVTKDNYFDLVFIDGDHSYDQTILDINLWLPKVASAGILCGHDCEARLGGGLTKARLWPAKNTDTAEGNDLFPVVHPGVILAVDEKFGSSVHLWAEETITLEDGKSGRSTVWDVSIRR
jgi:hypothetical protein